MSIDETLAKLCRLAGRYSKSQIPFRASAGEGVLVVQLLENLANQFSRQTKLKTLSNFQVTISKGQGNLPKIFWVAIVPTSRTVSTSVSATVCFGRRGEGLVAGLMLPRAGVLHTLTTVMRSGSELNVDVDGEKAGTQYNDCFVNPKEWLVSNIRSEEIIEHLDTSIDLLAELSLNGGSGYALL